jgi:hypothetical protein
MASENSVNAGAQLQLFCTDSTREYAYLGPLQDWLTFQYPNKPFPVLQALAEQGKMFEALSKLARKQKKGNHSATVACDYLRLHCYSGKIIQRLTCHASEEGIHTFLNTILNGSSDADDAIKFINNHNLTMLVTHRTYTNLSNFTDDVVALLSWTDRKKSVVYIGWAAVSDGQLNLPSPSVDSTSPAYGLPVVPEQPKGFTRLGLMAVMLDLMELATCHYKKFKSQYIYLHLNPIQSPTHISPQPFWTKCGFDPVDETLVIAPITPTEDKNPVLRNQHALKTTVLQAEVLAGLKELRVLQSYSRRDGKSSDTDEELAAYSRAHQNPCPAVPTLTDAARQVILSEAARKAQEAQAAANRKREEDETARKAAEKLALEVAEMAGMAKEAHEAPEAADKLAPDTAVKRKAARAAAEKRFVKTTADIKTAQAALATAQAACTKTSNDVELAQQHLKVMN